MAWKISCQIIYILSKKIKQQKEAENKIAIHASRQRNVNKKWFMGDELNQMYAIVLVSDSDH